MQYVSTFYHSLRQSVRRHAPFSRSAVSLIGLIGLLGLWQLIAMLELYPRFIIPPPMDVIERFVEVASEGSLWRHTFTTLSQMLGGMVIGVAIGVTVGYAIAKNRTLEAVLSPIIVAVQSTPVVAYAPLLVIWFGTGATSKVITAALIVFFPMLMNTVIGIRNVPTSLHDLMRSLKATRWQTFTTLEVPAALPVLLGGLKVSATLAVIGAVVGEFVIADAGLGRLINIARYDYDTPLVLVAVIMLALIARSMYGVVSLLERRLLAWQRRGGSVVRTVFEA
jgi:NitT/TauT family transport system permease protein